MIYKIEITEVLQKTIEVDAYDVDDALRQVKAKYKNQEIILTENNYINTSFDFIGDN